MAVTGYMAPERNSMGMTRKFMMMLNPSKDVSRAAIRIPNEVMQNETRTATATTSKNCAAERRIPRKGTRTRMMTACATDMNVPETAFPTTMDRREMGATSISFMNPNSRSQTIEMEEKIDENRMVMPIMPGKMNCRYEKPVCGLMSELMPFPTTKSQSTGRASVPRSRLFSRKNLMNSRMQITYTGRSWIIAAPSGGSSRTPG